MPTLPPRAPRRAAALLLLALAGCETIDDALGPGDDLEPLDLDAGYAWVLEGWREGSREPVGRPSVHLTWGLPVEWDGEAFRVYSRRAGRSDYLLAATVTSCARGLCAYTDLDVAPGERYDYYVATLDERGGREVPSADAVRVDVPAARAPATPAAPETVALDGGAYLRWPAVEAERYQVFVERIDGRTELFQIGETDGTSFLDDRAENGRVYEYSVAAVDEDGHVGVRSEPGTAVPRPDYHAETAYAHEDDPASSGFRFVESDAEDPVLPGGSPSAQWRLERAGAGFRIVPLGATRVSEGIPTTALACGPELQSEGEACLDVRTAAGVPLGSAPVPVRAGDSYVLRVVAPGGGMRYGKVRVIGSAPDARGVPTLIFDWAYQLRADEPRLSRG